VIVAAVSYSSIITLAALSADVVDKTHSVAVMHDIEARMNDQKAESRGFLLDNSRQEELERYASNTQLLADDFANPGPGRPYGKGKAGPFPDSWQLGWLPVEDGQGHRVRACRQRQRGVALLYDSQTVALRNQTANSLKALAARETSWERWLVKNNRPPRPA